MSKHTNEYVRKKTGAGPVVPVLYLHRTYTVIPLSGRVFGSIFPAQRDLGGGGGSRDVFFFRVMGGRGGGGVGERGRKKGRGGTGEGREGR